MSDPTTFSPKLPNEQIFVTADFTPILAPLGATIVSTVVTAAVRSGRDANPTAILGGAQSTHSGNVVSQRIVDGIAGVVYSLNFEVVSSDNSRNSVVLLLPVAAYRLG